MVFRRYSIALAVAVTVGLLASGCSSSSSSGHPPTTITPSETSASTVHSSSTTAGPTAWSKAKVTGFPNTDFPLIVDSLYLNGQWYIAVQKSLEGQNAEVYILSSADGVNWKDISPPLYTAANAGQLGAPQDLLTTDGNKVYLIGSSDVGLDVWAGGPDGFDSSIGTYKYYSSNGNFVPVGVVSSKGCIYWAVAVYPQGSVTNGYAALGANIQELDVWSYCNGTMAPNPATIRYSDDDAAGWYDFKLTADSDGAVLFARGSEYRISGDQLQRVRAIPVEPMLTVTNGNTVVGVQVASANLAGQGVGQVWSSAGTSVTSSGLPVGQLPDAGVAPAGGQTVSSGCSDGTGFVLAGLTSPNQNRSYGAVWTSPDGRNWTKMPVTPNGLDQFIAIFGVGCSPSGILLIGDSVDSTGKRALYSWKGRVVL